MHACFFVFLCPFSCLGRFLFAYLPAFCWSFSACFLSFPFSLPLFRPSLLLWLVPVFVSCCYFLLLTSYFVLILLVLAHAYVTCCFACLCCVLHPCSSSPFSFCLSLFLSLSLSLSLSFSLFLSLSFFFFFCLSCGNEVSTENENRLNSSF